MLISTNSISFGNIEVGTSNSQTFQITNNQASVLSVSLSVDNPKFVVTPLSRNINPSNNFIFSVQYNPDSINDDVGQITITSNDLITPIAYIGLTGFGRSATIGVSRIVVDFGNVANLATKTEILIISNSSPIPLVISSIDISNIIFNIAETFPLIITSSHDVSINITGSSLGIKTASFTINSNDFNTPQKVVTLNAEVVDPEIVVSPTSYDFGITTVGIPKNKGITVNNVGVGDLNVVVSSTEPVFSAFPSSFTVGTGDMVLSIEFNPINAQDYSGNIVLDTNDSNHLQVLIPVMGKSLKSEILLDRTDIEFGLVSRNDTKIEKLIVRNVGVVDLIVSCSTTAPFSVNTFNFTLQPSMQQTLDISFHPDAITTYTEFLTLQTNSSSGEVAVRLSGRSVSAGIYVNKTSIDFGNTTIRDSKTENVIVSNISQDDVSLVLSSVTTTNPVFKETIDTFTIPKGNALSIPVVFTPVNVVLQTGQLIIESNDSALPIIQVSLRGTGIVAPNINLSTIIIGFGNVEINTTAQKTFRINNSGLIPLSVYSMTSSEARFSVTPVSATIAANSSKEFIAKYSPLQAITDSGRISISNNDPDTPVVYLDVSGSGISSVISVSPNKLEFGNVSLTEEKQMILSILNRSPVRLIVSNITITNPRFSIQQTFPVSITSQLQIPVSFIPTTISDEISDLAIYSNDVMNPIIHVPVVAKGVSPDIALNPSSIDFANVAVGNTKTIKVIVTNLGVGRLHVTNIVSSYHLFSTEQTTLTIESHSSTELAVVFNATETGQKSGIITLTSNDPDAPLMMIGVTGYGANPNAGVSTTSINFGSVAVNDKKEMTFTLSNSGARVDLTASLSTSLTIYTVSESTLTVPANNSGYSITVTFQPTALGTFPSTLIITTNDPVHPTLSISLSGTGIVAPRISVAPPALNFGSIAVGKSKQLQCKIGNLGTLILTYSIQITNPIKIGKPPVFSVSPSSGSVGIGSTSTLSVSFRPSDPEELSGEMRISSNDLNHPNLSVPLSGLGTPAVLEWRSFNTSELIPDGIKELADRLNEIITPLNEALDFATKILEIIKIFIIDKQGLIEAVLKAVYEAIQNFINNLKASGLYVLQIAPGKFNINPLTYPEYFRTVKPEDLNYFKGSSWFDSIKGGYSSFVSKVVQSFDDPGDGNRPQFNKDAVCGAFVLMLDSGSLNPDDIAPFLNSFMKLIKIFQGKQRLSFEAPTNIQSFASDKKVKVTFSPLEGVLPKEYFIFRSQKQGGDLVLDNNETPYVDENGRPLRSYDLVAITNVVEQIANIMKTSKEEASNALQSAFGSIQAFSSQFLSSDPVRFIWEDSSVSNDTTYYYVIAAGYTTSEYGSDSSKYVEIIDQGLNTTDFEKRLQVSPGKPSILVEGYPKLFADTGIFGLGLLSSETSAKPTNTLRISGNSLSRCRNYRCLFFKDNEERIAVTKSTNFQFNLQFEPIKSSVKIEILRGETIIPVTLDAYRIDKLTIIFRKAVYQMNDNLKVTYKYSIQLKTKSATDNKQVDANNILYTSFKPIKVSSVKIIKGSESVSFTVLNEKTGQIKITSGVQNTIYNLIYEYYESFEDEGNFQCVKPEFSRYYFDINQCDAGTTGCPGYDNACCYYNTGNGVCTNTQVSQRQIWKFQTSVLDSVGIGTTTPYSEKVVSEDIPFSSFFDPVACQNGIMKQRCDGYSKTDTRYVQKQWPDWESFKLSPLKMFPVINDVLEAMLKQVKKLITGTEKMGDSIVSFIELLQKKIASLQQFIKTIQSYINIITVDFDIPNVYLLVVPPASGGNEYIKTSIQTSIKGPDDNPHTYTAGIVLMYGGPGAAGVGEVMSKFFKPS